MEHWPQELYLPGPVIDRDNRENWEKKGSPDLHTRTQAEVKRRLATYEPVETAPEVEAALQELITSGLEGERRLPEVPPPADDGGRRSGRRRRRRKYRRQR